MELKLEAECISNLFSVPDRPDGLPKKSLAELQRHQKEIASIQASMLKNVKTGADDQKILRENQIRNLINVWQTELLPQWKVSRYEKRTRHIWLHGLPSSVRGRVWLLVIGNTLGLTREIYDKCLSITRERRTQSSFKRDSLTDSLSLGSINSTDPSSHESSMDYSFTSIDASCAPEKSNSINCAMIDKSVSLIDLDITRTFPNLKLFNESGPYHESLRNILDAYVAYNSSLGYVQGMPFLAAIFLMVFGDEYEAFLAFAHLLDRPCHKSLFMLDETELMVYIHAFDRLMEHYLKPIYNRLVECSVEPFMYWYDWLLTMFSRVMSLETCLFVWDLFFLDGEIALFRVALALLKLNEDKIMRSDSDEVASFLTKSMPADITPDLLMPSIDAVSMSQNDFISMVDLVRKKLQLGVKSTEDKSLLPEKKQASNGIFNFRPVHSGGYAKLDFDMNQEDNQLTCESPTYFDSSQTAMTTPRRPVDKRINMGVHDRKLSVSMDRSLARAAKLAFGISSTARETTYEWNATAKMITKSSSEQTEVGLQRARALDTASSSIAVDSENFTKGLNQLRI